MFVWHLREVVRRNIEINAEEFNVEKMDANGKKEVRHVEGWVIKNTAGVFLQDAKRPPANAEWL